jgi:hypothetical protein
MGISTFPNVASPIKSIQRGVAVSAGSITITAVNTAKTMVNSFSTGSAGTVAATGDVAAASGTTSGFSTSAPSGSMTLASSANTAYQITTPYSTYNVIGYPAGRYSQLYLYYYQYFVTPGATGSMSLNALSSNGMNVAMNTQSISGGTTSLTAAVYGAYLSNSTTLVVTGPCRYEVVEHY